MITRLVVKSESFFPTFDSSGSLAYSSSFLEGYGDISVLL